MKYPRVTISLKAGCYAEAIAWASRALGIPHVELAKRLELSKGNISVSVERGEKIAKTGKYSLEL